MSSAPGIGLCEPPPVTRRVQLPPGQSTDVELESPLVVHASEGDLDEDIGGRQKKQDVSTRPPVQRYSLLAFLLSLLVLFVCWI